MKLFLVRHGESVLNAAKVHQYPHTELSRLGMAQAKALARRFRKVKVDTIYCSDYTRAVQTATAIHEVSKGRMIHTDLIREWSHPSEMDGMKYHARDDRIWGKRAMHIDDPEWHYSDEENFFDLRRRTVRFMSQLKKSKDDTVVAVTHGRTICMILAIALFGEHVDGKSLLKMIDFFHANNTGVTELVLDRKGKWELFGFNDRAHLG